MFYALRKSLMQPVEWAAYPLAAVQVTSIELRRKPTVAGWRSSARPVRPRARPTSFRGRGVTSTPSMAMRGACRRDSPPRPRRRLPRPRPGPSTCADRRPPLRRFWNEMTDCREHPAGEKVHTLLPVAILAALAALAGAPTAPCFR